MGLLFGFFFLLLIILGGVLKVYKYLIIEQLLSSCFSSSFIDESILPAQC